MPESDSLYFFVKGKYILKGDTLMSEVYDQRKDVDGFLYITYTDESTLGEVFQATGAVPGALIIGVENLVFRVQADAARGADSAGGRRELVRVSSTTSVLPCSRRCSGCQSVSSRVPRPGRS